MSQLIGRMSSMAAEEYEPYSKGEALTQFVCVVAMHNGLI